MGVIKNLRTLLGTKIFPVTLTKAVYSSDGKRLDNILPDLCGKLLWENNDIEFDSEGVGTWTGKIVNIPTLSDYDIIEITFYSSLIKDSSVIPSTFRISKNMLKASGNFAVFTAYSTSTVVTRYAQFNNDSITFNAGASTEVDNGVMIPALIIGYNLG